jgi:multiple sugar transport system substrate-binding protein
MRGRGNVPRSLLFFTILIAFVLYAVPITAAQKKITFMGFTANFGPELEEAFALFTERTGIVIEQIPVASWPDMNQKFITMSAAGVAPDVVYGDDLRIFSFAEQKLLHPIDDLIVRDRVNMQVYPAPVVQLMKVRGHYYSLPTADSIKGTFYNVNSLDRHGIPPLPTNWFTDEFTWEDFVAAAKKMTYDSNGDGVNDYWGLHGFGSYGGYNQIGLWGVQDIDPNRTQYRGTDPEVVQAVEEIMKLYTEYNVRGGAFLNGTAAMQVVQSYYVNNIRTQMESGNMFEWRLGVLPKAKQRVSQGAFLSIGMSAHSNNKEEAWQLIRFLAYETEGAMLFTRAENRTPMLRDTMRDYLQRWERLMPGSNLAVFTDATAVMWRWYLMTGYGATDIGDILNQSWTRIRTGQVSAKADLEAITPVIQAILDQNK